MRQGTMLNAYPDSLGKNTSELVELLSLPEMKDTFQSIYLLPSVFNSDIDRGYSVISYDLAESRARREDFECMKSMGLDMQFDFILNHLSVLSPQFRDLLEKGEESEYRDFFIDWNRFWEGYGSMSEEGVMVPDPEYLAAMKRRKKSLPVLMVRFRDGREVPYWNTFFKKVFYPKVDAQDLLEVVSGRYDVACIMADRINAVLSCGGTTKDIDFCGYEGDREALINYMEDHRRYLGQMDVNVHSKAVWRWFEEVMDHLSELGAARLRLDACFCLLKEPGKIFPTNCPEEWELLGKLSKLAADRGMDVLAETHVSYKEGSYRRQWDMGVPCYDYFLPALLLDAMERGDSQWIYQWAKEQAESGVRSINMLGCHDGIPLSDPRGALPDELVDNLEEMMVSRGGRRKYVHGDKTSEVYQMDIAYYSALGCDDRKLTLARAVQIFMPGKPQIWYQDLLAGANDLEVFERDPEADNREINRHNYSMDEILEQLKRPVVQEQLELLRLRNTHPAFTDRAEILVEQPTSDTLRLTWKEEDNWITLDADFTKMEYQINTGR